MTAPSELHLDPKIERPQGERCNEPVVHPREALQALRLAEVAKALGDPLRLQLVDVLRKYAGELDAMTPATVRRWG